jgi:hypothetical protein
MLFISHRSHPLSTCNVNTIYWRNKTRVEHASVSRGEGTFSRLEFDVGKYRTICTFVCNEFRKENYYDGRMRLARLGQLLSLLPPRGPYCRSTRQRHPLPSSVLSAKHPPRQETRRSQTDITQSRTLHLKSLPGQLRSQLREAMKSIKSNPFFFF